MEKGVVLKAIIYIGQVFVMQFNDLANKNLKLDSIWFMQLDHPVHLEIYLKV